MPFWAIGSARADDVLCWHSVLAGAGICGRSYLLLAGLMSAP
jgi:hypothetical protein